MTFRTLISTQQLAEQLTNPQLVLVDCRHNLFDVTWGELAYRETHLPGAYFMHLDRDLSGAKTGNNGRHPLPDAAQLAEKLRALGIDDTSVVVAYDQNNSQFAVRLWWLLRWLGHTEVAVLDGGFEKWRSEGRSLDQAVPAARLGKHSNWPGAQQAVVDARYVLDHLNDSAMTLIDARTADRFKGENEPIDPVAGHIPGARNRPYSENLQADLTFKSAHQLRVELLALLEGRSADSVVHQCGSGVTACHNLLAMEIAGLTGSRLYPGSWSEWISDPGRPIA